MRPGWRGPVALLGLCGFLALGSCGEETKEASPDPSHPDRDRVLAFWGHLRAATAARIDRDFEKAAGLYEQALALDATHEDGLYYLGYCRRELGQPQAARAAFQRLVETNPMSARGHMALGALLASPDPSEAMDLPEAERQLRRAHELNAEETGPVLRLGEVALVAGRPDEAGEWFEAALRTNPKSVEAAFLAGYLAWEEGGDRGLAPHVQRVREAAAIDAPVKGVLGEGDRREGGGKVAAPPLESPLGRLLFGEPVRTVRSLAASGTAVPEASILEAWGEVRRLRREYEERARAAGAEPRQPDRR